MSAYPVTFESDYVERRSRLATFFRMFMVIPHLIVGAVYGTLAFFAIVGAWFALVFAGTYPKGLYDFVAGWTVWITQVMGYFLLLTDDYPPFWGNVEAAYPVRMRFAGPLPEYSRVKALFRAILAIPILVLRYVMQLLLEVGAVAAWFVIVFTGKQPQGLQEVLVLGVSYTARSDAYLNLLTETYPPFQEHGQLAAPSSPNLPAGAAAQQPQAPPISPSGPEAPTR